ncbi:hypothetical protein [Lentzea nigeriaca]|uniref:hypothetical protein n=1 Tax=Lentzea nigeriaca TaxID=1128665 RepID=UPI001EF969C9|nr:hypothetical protein [Lentzea nigeriaca]MBM7862615.1 hypothetical protein [Lentzea nigeriaca]
MLGATPATAQTTTPVPPAVVTAAPQPATAGGNITISWNNFRPCRIVGPITFTLDGAQVASAASAASGSVGATVPASTTAGSHTIDAYNSCNKVSTGLRVVVPPPPTTTQPPVTQPPVTNPPVTKPPVTRPPVTTTTTAPVTTTTTETTPPSSESPSSSSSEPSNPGDGVLVLDKDNIQPGDPLTATGTGCPKGAKVTLKSLGQDVGDAVADENGEFTSPVRFANIEPGRHKVRAECGITLVGNVDVTLSSSSGGTTSTLVVLLFFLLVGAAMLRRQFTGLRR